MKKQPRIPPIPGSRGCFHRFDGRIIDDVDEKTSIVSMKIHRIH